MSKRKTTNAYLAWSDLAFRSAEVFMASSIVIPHRLQRANTARQVGAMFTEKAFAATEASQSMARQWLRMSLAGTSPTPAQWAAFWTSGLMPFHRRARANARRVPS